MKIILGSGSKYKKEELAKAGFEFETMSADIDEKAIRHEDLYQLPLILAHAKADALLLSISEPACLITADSVVVCNGQLFEKPTSIEELKEWTKLYEHNPSHVATGIVVVNTKTGKRLGAVDVSNVVWGMFDEAKLEDIIATTNVLECAGFNQEMVNAFAVEHDPFDRLRGMPIDLVKKLLDEVQ
jgi:septum formation protein